jgi:hypothetical protein
MYQSINVITYTNEILSNMMTQDLLPRFTYFPASYSLLWRCTHLMDRELINYQELNPQRVPHIHSQDEDPPSHKLH